MKKRLKRCCHHCKKEFTPDPYNAYQQEYCTSSACRKASRRASSKKYRDGQKNKAQFKQDEKMRVNKWRKNNPGYWKRNKNEKKWKKNELPKVKFKKGKFKVKTEFKAPSFSVNTNNGKKN